MGYTGSQGAIVEIKENVIFSYKMHFLIKWQTVAQYAVEVKILFL